MSTEHKPKKWFYISAGLALLALVVACIMLNPTTSDFKTEVRQRLLENWEDDGQEGMKEVHDLAVQMVDAAMDRMTVRTNYGVCSLYTVEYPGGDLRYLGLLGWIIPLQRDEPFTNKP